MELYKEGGGARSHPFVCRSFTSTPATHADCIKITKEPKLKKGTGQGAQRLEQGFSFP
jgi:hypothetical protein